MHAWRRTVVALAAVVLAADAGAQAVVRDAVNDTRLPDNDLYVVGNIGWFYTPTLSYTLGGIYTRFFDAGTDRDVTVELLSAPRAVGGALLASATFNSALARGRLGGGFFAAPVALTAGTTYFVGFRNVAPPNARDPILVPDSQLLGVNYTVAAGARSLGAAFSDDANVGLYADRTTGPETQPILQFLGPADVSVVPEPATLALVAPGLVLVAGAALRRRRLTG
jgi:hypothetical protein